MRLLLAAAITSSLAAQQPSATIRSDVRMADSTTRAVGVVVTAVDSTGAEVARALTGSSGSVVLTLPPGHYALHALRVGFQPTIERPVTVGPGESRTVMIVLTSAAVQLSAVRVEDRSKCKLTDASRGVITLWDQARAALTASTLRAGDRPFDATLRVHTRYQAPGSERIDSERVEVHRGPTALGFVSVPAETLAVTGYVPVVGTRISYHAPDAHVLLSPSFGALHCFEVKGGGAAHAEWIGLAFRPASRRASIAEVEGVLWLDRQSAELRRLEFTYVNLPRNTAFDAADGDMTFARLATGDWIVSRWSIRSPVADEVLTPGRITKFQVTGLRTVTGIAESVLDGDRVLLEWDPAALVVKLESSDGFNHGRGATVRLRATPNAVITGDAATATFTKLLPGTYTVEVRTALADWLKADDAVSTARFDESNRAVTIVLPPAYRVFADACDARANRPMQFVHGLIFRGDSTPVAGQVVSIEYEGAERLETTDARGRPTSVIVPVSGSRRAASDELGRWWMCIPMGATGTLRVMAATVVLGEWPLKDALKSDLTPIVLRMR